jgi:hypothetical protein
MDSDFNIQDHLWIINIMVEALSSPNMPIRSHLTVRNDEGLTIAIYKDPNHTLWWKYKPPGGKYSSQERVNFIHRG